MHPQGLPWMTNYNIDFTYDKQNGDKDEKWDISCQHRKLWISFQQLFKIIEFNFAGSCLYSLLIVRCCFKRFKNPIGQSHSTSNKPCYSFLMSTKQKILNKFKKKKKKTFIYQLFDIY